MQYNNPMIALEQAFSFRGNVHQPFLCIIGSVLLLCICSLSIIIYWLLSIASYLPFTVYFIVQYNIDFAYV